MKSVFLSILMFVVVFTALKFNILALLSSQLLVYIAIFAMIVVMICGLYFIGVPKVSDFKKAPSATGEKKDE